MTALAEISKGISGSRAATLAIVGGTLIDGTGAAPVADSAVVIHNGRIVAAGPRQGEDPQGRDEVDAHGKTILPGLWDMHAHFEQVEWGPIYLAAGVTTVRDCGNEFEFITAVRDAVAQGRGSGHGCCWRALWTARHVHPRRGARRHARAGANVDRPISRRGFSADEDLQFGELEELKDVADEAHRLGMTVTGTSRKG